MKREDIIRKLTSRKLWMSIASFVSMLMIAMGHAESEGAQIAALIMAGATVIGYAIGEGLADAGNSGGIIVDGEPIEIVSGDTDTKKE